MLQVVTAIGPAVHLPECMLAHDPSPQRHNYQRRRELCWAMALTCLVCLRSACKATRYVVSRLPA